MAKTTRKTTPKPALAGEGPAGAKKTAGDKPAAKKAAVKKAAVKKTAVKKSSAKKAAPKKATAKKGGATRKAATRHISAADRRQMIAEAAYLRGESQGFLSDEREDWLHAEAEVDALLAKAGVDVRD